MSAIFPGPRSHTPGPRPPWHGRLGGSRPTFEELHARASAYLETLGIARSERSRRAWRAVRASLAEGDAFADESARLRLLRHLRKDLGAETLPARPALARGWMRRRRSTDPAPAPHAWRRTARWRRAVLLALVGTPAVLATAPLLAALPHGGALPIEWAIAACFAFLFAWISIGFWTALTGFLVMLRGDRFALQPLARRDPLPPEARTALLLPISNESVSRVFAGLRAMHDSLEQRPEWQHFDFFVLSDSSDLETWVQEETAWADLCRQVDGFGRIFYRRRRLRIGRKAGNVADFCRRWGRAYRYMIVLDADSIMSGEALVELVRQMEAHPEAALIQSAPVAVLGHSLHARIQQFARRLYGPLFSAGLHFWQLGDGQYWGHNAIVRVQPFMEHCSLPRLSGRPPLGGEIWSHDFVEAALLGRAGHALWLAYDLPGSYEETPPSILEELRRDRRWCQGNLQHLRLLGMRGLRGAHRGLFLNGALSYISSSIWLAFLLLVSAEALWLAPASEGTSAVQRLLGPLHSLTSSAWLCAITGVTLFTPKLLGVIYTLWRHGAGPFGGLPRLLASTVLETLLSSLLAPIRMAFHVRFVRLCLLGLQIPWLAQQRRDCATSWSEAARSHGLHALLAAIAAGVLLAARPQDLPWIAPVLLGLMLAPALSVWTSRVSLGSWALRRRLFVIPEETAPPAELAAVSSALELAPQTPSEDPFVLLVRDPWRNALHCAIERGGKLERARRYRHALRLSAALRSGPSALDERQRRMLLANASLLRELHLRVWALPDHQAREWGIPTPAPQPRHRPTGGEPLDLREAAV